MYRRIWSILLIIAFAISLSGCAQLARKPEITPLKEAKYSELADEVKKYKEEPTISLYRTKTHKTQNIKLEQYIKGVVAAEIGDKFPLEALKAQAIVARTMTLTLLEYEGGTRSKYNTDASDDHTEFQAYDETRITDKISQAVDETRGEILTYNGKFAYAMFSSVSNGKTASIEEGFPKLKNKASYLVPVETNGIDKAPQKYQSWTVKIPRTTIQKIMGSGAGNLNDIKIADRGPSGRVLKVTAGSASITGVDLREEVGFDRLYSTQWESITPQGKYIVFKGSGWGHGVGMEQWGAYAMADEGKNAREIIQHYFPNNKWYQLYK